MKTFGQLVRKIREDKKILLQDLAKDVGKSTAYLSQIENPRSGTPPSDKVGKRIIEVLHSQFNIEPDTKTKLEKALERTLREHKVERVYNSSLLLEEFFRDAKMGVEEIANKMPGKKGTPRSRQIVQVWKNGVQLPTREAAINICHVFADAGIKQDRLNEYLRKHIYDTVFSSKDIDYFPAEQRQLLARCAVEIADGQTPQLISDEPIESPDPLLIGAGKRRYRNMDI